MNNKPLEREPMNNEPLEREPIDRMRARLEALLKANAARSRGRIRTTPDHLSQRHRCRWQGREGFRAQAVGPWIPTAPIDTREERIDNSPVGSKRGQNIVKNRRGGRSAPTTVNSSVRTREYLTTAEIERLMAAARKSSRYDHRDATMILIGYRHGLRASELCDLHPAQDASDIYGCMPVQTV
jgi:integrase